MSTQLAIPDVIPSRFLEELEDVSREIASPLGAPYRVHTHDRISFKSCRRRWYFSSLQDDCLGLTSRGGWTPYLDLGTGVHFALAHYYKPGWERGSDPVQAFDVWGKRYKERYIDRNGPEAWSEDAEILYRADMEMGRAVLGNYTRYAPSIDNFEVVSPEQVFSVPVRDVRGRPVIIQRRNDPLPRPVLYEGRFDAIVRDRDGLYWLLEHKTAGRAVEERKLVNDEQIGSYVWAARYIYGFQFAGIMYNVLYKKIPSPPASTYGGSAVSRAQAALGSATLDLYYKAIKDAHLDPRDYLRELKYLSEVGWSNFFYRAQVERNPAEISAIGLRIYYEVMDMTRDDLFIYPNADPMKCPGCPFRVPCMQMDEGSEWLDTLKLNYVQRDPHDTTPLEYMPL